MSMLAQALGRGLEAAGETASKGLLMKMNQDHERELEEARALRARSLAEYQNQFHAGENEKQREFAREQTDTAYERSASGAVDANGLPLTRDDVAGLEPGEFTTPEQYRQSSEIKRTQRIGEKLKEVSQNFQWNPKDPQQSAADYMQTLRATGEMTEAEAINETNRMLQAKMPKDPKVQVTTVPMGNGKEQAVIVNLDTQQVTPIGKASDKFAPDRSHNGEPKELTKNEASKIVREMTKRKRENGGTLDADESEQLAMAKQVLGLTSDGAEGKTHYQKNDPNEFASSFGGSKGKGLIASAQAANIPATPAKMNVAAIDAQAEAAIMQVNSDRSLSPAQRKRKLDMISERRNRLIGG